MNCLRRTLLISLSLLLSGASVARAQSGTSVDEILGPIKSQSVIDDANREKIRSRVSEWIGAIVDERSSIGARSQSAARLRNGATGGTAAYRNAFADVFVSLIAPVYKRAELARAAQLVALVGTVDDARAVNLLVGALSDKRVAVRSAASAGLRRLSQRILSEGPARVDVVIEAIKTAAVRETSPVALRTHYAALAFSGATLPNPKSQANALIEVLDQRSRAYQQDFVPAWAADTPGLGLAKQIRSQFSDAQVVTVTTAATHMFRAAVLRYGEMYSDVDDDDASGIRVRERDQTELLISAAENLLLAVVRPDGLSSAVVSDVMSRTRDGVDMKNAFNESWALPLEKLTGKDFRVQ